MLTFRAMMKRWPVIFALAAAVSTAAPAQNTPASAAAEPDIAILASVHAKTLQFTVTPDVNVTFPDQEKNQTVWRSDRTNLPQQVQPNVIYRDIGIRLTISSSLPNIEQIVDEALGPATTTKPAPKPASTKSKSRRR